MKKKFTYSVSVLLLLMLYFSCVEEIDLKQETEFESLLVVEATISDNFGFQEIKLSRSYALDTIVPSPETGANVKVVGNDGSNFNFQQNTEGIYISTVEFAAQPNIEYRLELTTSDGKQYTSGASSLASESIIGDLYVERDFNENGEEGVSVYVDVENPTSDVQLYRYQYEETYKIIAPQYNPNELIINNDDFVYPPPGETFFGFSPEEIVDFFVIKQQRPVQEAVCYNTVASTDVFIASSEDFEQNTLEKFRIRFISRLNYIMQHRYSILVKQYTQSPEAHEFYRILREFSQSQSLLSQVQPGFLQGNLIPLSDQNENVAGFFEVASLDQERVYFNYVDLFPGEPLPPYYLPCIAEFIPDLFIIDPLTGEITDSPIQQELRKDHKFFANNFEGSIDETNFFNPYILVLPYCGDCTVLGDNVVPDFWEE